MLEPAALGAAADVGELDESAPRMSDAVAVFHGNFGRVCLYSMDRPWCRTGTARGI
jgi:hypothetical protein